MYVNSGYLYNSRVDFKDHSRPLIVGSCGTYRLKKHPVLPSHRPKGRVDYQLLYIATGKAHFYFQGKETVVPAGHVVLYCPGEEQKYTYYAADAPEVFWVHFTGYDVKNILKYYHFSPKRHVYYSGTLPEYKWIFQRMIQELQLCRPLYEELLASLLNSLLLLMNRQAEEGSGCVSGIESEIETAVSYFSSHYDQKISVEDYARERHISVNYFIRNFKQYMKMTPGQYILSVRMANAQHLLEQSDYNITQIASIVGYDDPLYFSRVFKKQVGISPSQYRRRMLEYDDPE